jgi:hypothetical protein
MKFGEFWIYTMLGILGLAMLCNVRILSSMNSHMNDLDRGLALTLKSTLLVDAATERCKCKTWRKE